MPGKQRLKNIFINFQSDTRQSGNLKCLVARGLPEGITVDNPSFDFESIKTMRIWQCAHLQCFKRDVCLTCWHSRDMIEWAGCLFVSKYFLNSAIRKNERANI
jgi:hypothetical protein